jgi:putative photosynthetic complex assembly protein
MQTTTAPAHPASSMVVPLIAIAVVVLGTMAYVFLKPERGVDVPTTIAGSKVAVVTTRDIRFEDQLDGGIEVRDATTNTVIERVAPETNGFMRGAVRSLVRERKRSGIGADKPFSIVALADARLVLRDNVTDHEIDLASFGSTNAVVFAKLLSKPDAASKITKTMP